MRSFNPFRVTSRDIEDGTADVTFEKNVFSGVPVCHDFNGGS